MDDDGADGAAREGRARPEAEAEAELRELYRRLDAEIAQRGPVCQLSGRCCRFQEHGHALFASSLEIDYLLEHAPAPSAPLDEGATCPWQDALGRCTARDARPLGCRVYFCDPGFQDAMPELAEDFLGRLKTIVQRLGLPWRYASLHRHLHERWAGGQGAGAASANANANANGADAGGQDGPPGRAGFHLDSNPSHQYT